MINIHNADADNRVDKDSADQGQNDNVDVEQITCTSDNFDKTD